MPLKLGRYRNAASPTGWTDLFASNADMRVWVAGGRPNSVVKAIIGYEPGFNRSDFPDISAPMASDVLALPVPESNALIAAGIAVAGP